MRTLIVNSAAAAALALGLATASAQPRPEGDGATMLTPEQRSAIRNVIRERLGDEMRDRLAERLADEATGATTLSPEQRSAIRSAIRERLADEVRAGVAERLAEDIRERLAEEATGAASTLAARADEAQAKSLFKAMSDYMAAQKAISLEYDSTLEVVAGQDQKLAVASSGTVTLNRPDKLHATRTGGFANVELVFDGKTLTVLDRNANASAQVDAAGTIDRLVDELRDKYHRPMPAADLLMSDPYSELMPLVVDAKDLGSGVIRGLECDHLAFRTEDVDWQIWIAQGDRPYPCRYVITSKKVAGSPQYTIDVRTWKTGAEVASAFRVEIPAGAKKLNPGDFPDYDDLSGIYAAKR
jgi:hypothetical protein